MLLSWIFTFCLLIDVIFLFCLSFFSIAIAAAESLDGVSYYYLLDDDDDDDDDDLDAELERELNGELDDDSNIDEYSYHMSMSGYEMDNDQNQSIDGRFKCACGKSYKEERYRRYHRKWECGKLPTFKCPHCGYMAKRKNSLKQHIERRHFDIAFTKIFKRNI